MTDRKKFKNWSYGLFYFIETEEVGIAKTSIILDGFKDVFKGGYVKIRWPVDKLVYKARVLDVGGK